MSSEQKYETGIVSKIATDTVVISRQDNGACGVCNIKSICSFKNQKEIVIDNTNELALNEEVDIIITPSQRMFSSFIVYLVPVFILFLLYYVFYGVLGLSESLSVLLSFLWIPISIVAIFFINKNASAKMRINVKKKDTNRS